MLMLWHCRSDTGNHAVSTTDCTVVSEVEMRCATPPGTGTGYRWSVTVAGQSSQVSVQSTSYGLPVVLNVTSPVLVQGRYVVPTAGGAVVTVSGRNFGADVREIAVHWNGLAVPSESLILSTPHYELQFTSLSGKSGLVRFADNI